MWNAPGAGAGGLTPGPRPGVTCVPKVGCELPRGMAPGSVNPVRDTGSGRMTPGPWPGVTPRPAPGFSTTQSAYSTGNTTRPPRCQSQVSVGSVPGTNHSVAGGHSGPARIPES